MQIFNSDTRIFYNPDCQKYGVEKITKGISLLCKDGMQRPIKFRAWDVRNEVMWLRKPKQLVSEFFQLIEQDTEGGEQFILMQYTGLKDKNGVEIYEGDILQGVAGSYKVKWNNNTLNWVAYDGGNLGLWAFNEPEVIGNIWEHPELLEKTNDQL